VAGGKRTFMGCDAMEFPNVIIIFVLFEALYDITAGNDVLERILVHGTDELDLFRVIFQLLLFLVNGLDNSSSEALSVFLRFRQEGLSDEIARVNDLELSLWDCVTTHIFN
jgi:hypothetical protein